VKLVDANVLLYAVNSDSQHHREAVQWLDGALSGGATVGFSWVPVLAFLRLATKRGLFPRPLHHDDALTQLDAWLSAPSAVVVEPTARHASLLRDLLGDAGTAGNLVNDAHLAALAIEHSAQLISYDSDFARFPGLDWTRPDP
jgi:toxin-antitoxin system PIN domain toxin